MSLFKPGIVVTHPKLGFGYVDDEGDITYYDVEDKRMDFVSAKYEEEEYTEWSPAAVLGFRSIAGKSDEEVDNSYSSSSDKIAVDVTEFKDSDLNSFTVRTKIVEKVISALKTKTMEEPPVGTVVETTTSGATKCYVRVNRTTDNKDFRWMEIDANMAHVTWDTLLQADEVKVCYWTKVED